MAHKTSIPWEKHPSKPIMRLHVPEAQRTYYIRLMGTACVIEVAQDHGSTFQLGSFTSLQKAKEGILDNLWHFRVRHFGAKGPLPAWLTAASVPDPLVDDPGAPHSTDFPMEHP